MFIEEETLGCLSKVSSKQLAQNITSFIEETYSLKASKEDIFEVCRAAIVLFPSLETKPSHLNGIVCRRYFSKCDSEYNFYTIIL